MNGADFVTFLPVTLNPDPMRTVIRPFVPGDPDAFVVKGHPRGERIIARVLALAPDETDAEFDRVSASLDERHRNVDALLMSRFEAVADMVPGDAKPTDEQKRLIGAYFSAEFSFEAAALFNPSIVSHPDQSGAPEGATRFVISLRGIGEGHMSSATFRTGTWTADGAVEMDEASETAVPPVVGKPHGWSDKDTVQLDCNGSREPSETVLFPIIESQSRGIEDLRLTGVELDDGSRAYAGTFTALGDKGIQQQLLLTDDFRTFKMHPVYGELSGAKGMALFPRKIDDRFLALARVDNENLWLFSSEDRFTYADGVKILEPEMPWEYVQIGNCGSPIEIDEGWLVLTHGVGVVRNYCMGAALLDRDDPTKVLGRLKHPLIEPADDMRDGYVPNVVYSCGGLVRDRTLLLPYGVADNFTSFATVPLDALVKAILKD